MQFQHLGCVIAYLLCAMAHAAADVAERNDPVSILTVETRHLRLVIDSAAQTREFTDLASGANYAATGANYAATGAPLCIATIDGATQVATSAHREADQLYLAFGETQLSVVLRIETRAEYLICEVIAVEGSVPRQMTFVDIPLTLTGRGDEYFAATAMALNLRANVETMPMPVGRLTAVCYERFGMVGARVALVGCPRPALRDIQKTIVRQAPELPQTTMGGPFALDEPRIRGSYLMDVYATVSEARVQDWIRMARELGIHQLDFHAGVSMRFGDYEPSPDLYPNGVAGLKSVVSQLRDAGIMAGLHTYAFFIAKDTPWVTPKPHPNLAKSATFTLELPVSATDTTLRVIESTERMHTKTGFFEPNSLTLQIDDELIVFHHVSSEAPFAFSGCERGAHGTTPAPHAAGAKVCQLKEMFFLFVPEPDSPLFHDVIDRIAYIYNECGFTMMYHDALDGSGVLAGAEDAWYWGSKFIFDLMKKLNRPPLMEMSTFHHHLWYTRSRVGAWDVPKRSYKNYVDLHVIANQSAASMFLPAHLGWWAVWDWSAQDHTRTFPEDVEYLLAKCAAHGAGLSLVHGFQLDEYFHSPNKQRLGKIVERYERLRMNDGFPPQALEMLRVPGDDYTLVEESPRDFALVPLKFHLHTIRRDAPSASWQVNNAYAEQPLRLRIEALSGMGKPEDGDAVPLSGFDQLQAFTLEQHRNGVHSELLPAAALEQAVMKATNASLPPRCAWTMRGRRFATPMDLTDRGLGVWVDGDGSGAVLNLQLKTDYIMHAAYSDHYIPLDFTGRRYVELVEPESDNIPLYDWPYFPARDSWTSEDMQHVVAAYSAYFFLLERKKVEELRLYLNNLPTGGSTRVGIGPIVALPLRPLRLERPTVTVNGRPFTVPVNLDTGHYLELQEENRVVVYDRDGSELAAMVLEQPPPALRPGWNDVTFATANQDAEPPRARVTVIARGEPYRWSTP